MSDRINFTLDGKEVEAEGPDDLGDRERSWFGYPASVSQATAWLSSGWQLPGLYG